MDPTDLDVSGASRSDAGLSATPTRELRAARAAVAAIFFANGFVFGNWVPRIPAVQEELGLGEGRLGLALLGSAVGALLAMPATGWLVGRYGSRPVTTAAVLLCCLTLALPPLAVGVATLGLGLLVFGAGFGALDVSMNAQGVAVERRYGRPILSSFHAAFSFGGLAGAGVAGPVAGAGVAPLPHLLVVGALSAVGGVAASRALLPASADAGRAGLDPAAVEPGATGGGPAVSAAPDAKRRVGARLPRRLLLLGAVAFACLLAEGAIADWSAVYMDANLGTGPGLAAAGFAAFSLTMAVGRLLGDRFAAAWGPVALVRRGGALVAAALGLALLADQPAAAVVGFAGVGVGLAAIVPVVFSAAGQTSGLAPGPAIAAVSTMGYTGFLVGPPAIGLLAEAASLPIALGVVVGMGVAMAALAGSVAPVARTTRPVGTTHPQLAER